MAGVDDGSDMPHPVVDEGGSKRLGHLCAAIVLERQGDLQVLADCVRRRGAVRELLMANVTPRSRGLGIVDIAAETLHDRLALVVEHAAVHGEDQCRVRMARPFGRRTR